jgi:hypothetical protein
MRTEIRLIKTEPVPKCGTYEVRISYIFDWDDEKSRRLRPGQIDGAEALGSVDTYRSHRTMAARVTTAR